MNTFSKLTAGAAVAVAMIAGPALADGYSAPKKGGYAAPAGPVCDAAKFGGAFVGIHGGFGTLSSNMTDMDDYFDKSSTLQVNDGLVLGGQIGYNFARCNTIFGIEADFSWSNIDDSRNYEFDTYTISHSINWMGSLRTKAGVAIGDLFIYATGGLAFANIETQAFYVGNNPLDFTSKGTRMGWVAGLGTEYALSDRVRLTGDVMYYDFGTETTFDAYNGGNRIEDHHSLWVSRIGLNFKLGHDGGSYGHAMK